MTDKDDAFLDDIFRSARTDDPVPSDDLRARVQADAMAAMVSPAVVPRSRSSWDAFAQLLGGWPALSGVAAAGVAGLWLGLAPPAVIESMAADVLGTTTSVTFFTGLEDFVGEGAIDG